MAHKKGMGSTRNGRDSNAQRRGTKAYGGQFVTSGSIIIRQCGTKFRAGRNVGIGRDNTVFATIDGYVEFVSTGSSKVINVWDEAPVPAS